VIFVLNHVYLLLYRCFCQFDAQWCDQCTV